MGWYLSHVGNQKADLSIGRFPDENYAREIMQLFTIGLWKLNPDGSRKTDSNGDPIPTYDNAEITELARVFTGLWYDSQWGWGNGGWHRAHFLKPMVAHAEHHDFNSKTLVDGFGIPARSESDENAHQDIEDAIAHLFNHPNTPIFISKQLIQFFVTANPSPAYIERIQNVFVNDGNGERGNLGAVIKAILLDSEAREVSHVSAPSYGKLKEPVIRTMALARALDFAKTHPDFVWWNPTELYYETSFQEPQFAPSVFNFFKPNYQDPGVIRDNALVSPSFQILDSYSSISFPNLLWDYLTNGQRTDWNGPRYRYNFGATLNAYQSDEALLDHLNLLFCAGSMTPQTRETIIAAINTNTNFSKEEKTILATYLTINSADGTIQK